MFIFITNMQQPVDFDIKLFAFISKHWNVYLFHLSKTLSSIKPWFKMGLLPLEFTDCLQDSPYFRDSLHSHEKELERTSNNIKELIKETKNLLQAAKSKTILMNTNIWWSQFSMKVIAVSK